jgi:hypothetical protein
MIAALAFHVRRLASWVLLGIAGVLLRIVRRMQPAR